MVESGLLTEYYFVKQLVYWKLLIIVPFMKIETAGIVSVSAASGDENETFFEENIEYFVIIGVGAGVDCAFPDSLGCILLCADNCFEPGKWRHGECH